MGEYICKIEEIRSNGENWSISLPQLQTLPITAGQFFLGFVPGSDNLLPVVLFSQGFTTAEGRFTGEIPSNWTPGDTLHIQGPLGNGFHFPIYARSVALVSLYNSSRLIPLIGAALRQNASVTWYGEKFPEDLPPVVEALPLAQLSEALSWADYLAVDCRYHELNKLRPLLGLAHLERIPIDGEVLVNLEMPCGGVSECGICSVRTLRGYQLVCKDGPVFEFNKLDPE